MKKLILFSMNALLTISLSSMEFPIKKYLSINQQIKKRKNELEAIRIYRKAAKEATALNKKRTRELKKRMGIEII